MKQKIVRRASALVLAGCLLAGAALPALAASAKEEVIYANLDASGTVTGVYAVNSFAVQAGDTVTDHGSYTAVRNMTTTDPLKHSGDTVTATMAQDGKLYYEGTMDTATALPWLVKLTYTLDGAEIAPEELGGKSGALTIRLQVSRNPDCTGDFFDQYALQVTMTLDTDRAQNIVADGATMANVGSNKQLSYILLPGSDSDVTVTADVTDFAMNAISLNGVKLRLNFGLDGADLTGMLDRLQSGSVQLDDGANALADGIAQVQAGLDTLNGKSGELTGGSAKVKAALTQMQTALNGVSASTDQLTTLLDASTQIQNGIAQLDAGAAQLDEQVSYDAYKAILKENGLDLDQLKDGNAKAMEQLEQLARVMPQLKDVILLLKGSSANIDAMETYLNTVHDGVAQLHAGSSTLNSQYGQFDAGVRQLANALTGMLGNLSVLTDGVNQLASRYGQLDSGLNAYTDGVAQLKAGVQQLTDGVNGNAFGGWVLGGYGTQSDVDMTAMAIQALAPKAAGLAGERINAEVTRMLTGPDPARAVRMLFDTGLLAAVLPEVAALDGVEQPPEFHPEGDVLTHTLLMLSHMACADANLAWSVLLHDISKPEARTVGEDGRARFYAHESMGAELAGKILDRLRFSSADRDSITQAVRNHMRFASVRDMRAAKLRQDSPRRCRRRCSDWRWARRSSCASSVRCRVRRGPAPARRRWSSCSSPAPACRPARLPA